MEQRFLGESLIFIISQPRAGSTLLQRLLAGNPAVLTSAEPWLMLHPLYALREKGIQAEYDSGEAHNALSDFLTYYAGGEEIYLLGISELARVLYSNALTRAGKTIFLDKTPRYYYIIPDLYRLFPRARFVFLVRNPLAVLASILKTWVGQEWTYLHNFRDDLLLAPERILAGRQLLGDEAIWVRYEDLVTRPADSLQAICHSLKIDYCPEMLTYRGREAPKGRRGDMVGINQHTGPAVDSLDTWKSMNTQDQTRQFAHAYLKALGPEIIQNLGYSFNEIDQAIGITTATSMKAIIPWEIAIRPKPEWTRTEHLVFGRVTAIQRYGFPRGLFYYWWHYYPTILRGWLGR